MPRAPEGADHAVVREPRETLLGERRAEQVPAELLEPGAVVGAHGAIGVEIEVREVGVAGADRPHPRGIGRAADAQHGRAGAVPKGRPTADGRGAELREHGGVDGERIGLEVRRLVRGEHPAPPQQAQDAGTDRREQARHLAIGGGWRGIEAGGAVRRDREDAVEHEGVEVDVELEAAADALDRRDRPAPAVDDPTPPASGIGIAPSR
jgi:hypothetical protein